MKTSESIIRVRLEELEPHPMNLKRINIEDESDPKKKEKLRDDQLKFEESIANSGIWDAHPLLVTKTKNENGKFYILRGRRRFEAVTKNIKKGKLPPNYKLPCFQLLENTDGSIREALFGDNDQGRSYTTSDRVEIIKSLIPLKRLLQSEKGTKGAGVLEELYKLLPFWSRATIKFTFWHVRKSVAGEQSYKEPNPEKIQNLNKLLLSIYNLHKSKTRINEDYKKQITSLEMDRSKKTQKIDKEIASFSLEFGKGGFKGYIRSFKNSKRPEFAFLKKLDNINALLE